MIFLAASTSLVAQERNQDRRNAPTTIRKSFERDNPGITEATWHRSQNNQWHAVYKDKDNRDVDAYYDYKGKRLSRHLSWDRKDVPPDLDKRIHSRYHVDEYEVHRIERPNYKPLFQIKLTIGGKNRLVYMDEQGRERKYSGN
jgi:hypothetical protein